MFPGPAGRLYRETLALQLVIQMYALYPALSGEWEVPVTRNAKITGGWGAPPLRDHLWQGPPLPVTLRLTQRLMTPHPPRLKMTKGVMTPLPPFIAFQQHPRRAFA